MRNRQKITSARPFELSAFPLRQRNRPPRCHRLGAIWPAFANSRAKKAIRGWSGCAQRRRRLPGAASGLWPWCDAGRKPSDAERVCLSPAAPFERAGGALPDEGRRRRGAAHHPNRVRHVQIGAKRSRFDERRLRAASRAPATCGRPGPPSALMRRCPRRGTHAKSWPYRSGVVRRSVSGRRPFAVVPGSSPMTATPFLTPPPMSPRRSALRAASSAVEHSLHTGGVTGSIPVPPTIQTTAGQDFSVDDLAPGRRVPPAFKRASTANCGLAVSF